jgi:CO/xanthine dehydrogenase FAD-binding subunit
MIENNFRYEAPTSIEQFADVLKKNPAAEILAGGYALISLLKNEAISPSCIISLDQIDSLKSITRQNQNTIRIGASVRLTDILENKDVIEHFPGLVDALTVAGDRQIRNQSALGDRHAFSSFGIGIAAALKAYQASFTHLNSAGKETKKSTLSHHDNEPLLFIDLPMTTGKCTYKELKDMNNNYPLVGVACQLVLEGEIITSAVIVLGGYQVEFTSGNDLQNYLIGKTLSTAVNSSDILSKITLKQNNSAYSSEYLSHLGQHWLLQCLSSF